MNDYKQKFYNYIILLTLFAVGATEIFSQDLQYVIALLGIFSFGILHGSNDLFVIEKLNQNDKQKQFLKSLFIYLAVVLAFVVVFYVVPLFALIAFVLISGYHFGEQHFHAKISDQSSILASFFYLCYGLLILFLLLYLNLEEVIVIIKDMTSYTVPDSLFLIVLIASFVLSLTLFYFNSVNNPELKSSALVNVLYLVMFTVLFYLSDVVWGFAAYFVLWHSIPSLKDQVNSLYGKFHFKNFMKYFKKAFPYWLASILGMVVVVWLFKDTKNFLSLLFAFIAAITFPHVFIMRKLFDRH
ncbi:Brp/Blh family beta-carotene 15,15'-dioxygenase [Psychroflexus lacisalsi]|jgi:Brp/Blh family beta-carotene 15,15'-monooxygenase|uniref:Probable beta-carotene 15,15'-dioxygenase n=1 Tax=Psychroflexus lacisalsi TaxID=503928 RepID=A0ABP3VKK8_9FLAO|nr:Brp/Blh family beta-carotene 15,15'-dioxygenase [Psychroflexus lacisalsi]MBZ9619624.1 Brp/Blh family beta-carotene 15,15'-dioxygenase [Psychroflexus lacisalsi]